jgi:gluconate 2-dehydrogenase gamma chain
MNTSKELSDLHQRFSRRIFIRLAARGVVSLGAVLPFGLNTSDLLNNAEADSLDDLPNLFSADERLLLNQVQEHLLPSELNSPGARDVRATRYLEIALTGKDIDERDLPRIKKGIETLRVLLKKRGVTYFSQLTVQQREKLLREIEGTGNGEVWLRLILGYTLEAYVGDPSYGGNTDGIVWAWLGHTPGYPRPPEVGKENRR